MRRLMLVLSVGVIMAMVVVAGAAPTLAQTSEDKAAKKAARQEQKAAKQQQKAAKQQLPASGGPPVGNVALFTLGASALVVGGVFLVGRTVAPRR
jgi:type II secretory pathway pseudopilin PulG